MRIRAHNIRISSGGSLIAIIVSPQSPGHGTPPPPRGSFVPARYSPRWSAPLIDVTATQVILDFVTVQPSVRIHLSNGGDPQGGGTTAEERLASGLENTVQ